MPFTMAQVGFWHCAPPSKNQMVGRSKGDIPLPEPALLQQLELYAEVWGI